MVGSYGKYHSLPVGQTILILEKEAIALGKHPLRSALALMLALSLTAALTVASSSAAGVSDPSAPIAQNLTLSTYQNLSVSGQFTARDPEEDLLRFQITSQPARGSVTLSDDVTGEFLYTPYDKKTGADSFTYVAIDAQGHVSSPATVNISIETAKNAMNYVDLEGSGLEALAQRLADEGIFVGATMGGNRYFQPEETVSRSQFLAMVMTACGVETLNSVTTTGFADDDAIPTWAKPYCATALLEGYDIGVTNEEGQTVFDPDSPITSAQAAVMLDEVMGLTQAGWEVSACDTEAVPAWAVQAAVDLTSCGISCTATEELLTREEAAVLLCGALNAQNARENSSWW